MIKLFKSGITYLVSFCLFYLQLATPLIQYSGLSNRIVKQIDNTAYAKGESTSTCDPKLAEELGVPCSKVEEVQDGDGDSSSLNSISDDSDVDQSETSSQKPNDSDVAQAQSEMEKVNFDESKVMLADEIIGGIAMLAIAVVAAMMVITCSKGICSAGVYVAGAGAALYLIGEIVAMVGYDKSAAELEYNPETLKRCMDKLQNSTRGDSDQGSGRFADGSGSSSGSGVNSAAGSGSGSGIFSNDSGTNKDDECDQFTALKKQKKLFARIRKFAIFKLIMQTAAVAAFLAAMGLEIALSIKDNANLTAAATVADVAMKAAYAPSCPAVCTVGAAACAASCTSCATALAVSLLDICGFAIKYNTIFGGVCNPSAAMATFWFSFLLVIGSRETAFCAAPPPNVFAGPAILSMRANMAAVSVNIGGHIFPNCNICGGPCLLVENQLQTPMPKEQYSWLQGKNLVNKLLDFVVPSAEASEAGNWIKGLGLGVIAIMVLMALLGGFTSLADALAVFPPSRAVVFGAMAALSTISVGITTGVIVEMDDRIEKIDAILSKTDDVEETPGLVPGVPSDATPPPAISPTSAPFDTSTPAPTPTPAPTSAPLIMVPQTWKTRLLSAVLDFFKFDISSAQASKAMSLSLGKNGKFPCFGKQKNGGCSTDMNQALAKIEAADVPAIIKQQAQRAVRISKEINGGNGISLEALELSRTMVKNLSATKSATDKLEKAYEKSEVAMHATIEKSYASLRANYNNLSDEEKQKFDQERLRQLQKQANLKPVRMHAARESFLMKMQKTVQQVMAKISDSARKNLYLNKVVKKSQTTSKYSKLQGAVDGSYSSSESSLESDSSQESIAKMETSDQKDTLDELEITVDDIEKNKDVSIFDMISQRYRIKVPGPFR